MNRTFKIKRGPKNVMPNLSDGEFGLTLDTAQLYIGLNNKNHEVLMKEGISELEQTVSDNTTDIETIQTELNSLDNAIGNAVKNKADLVEGTVPTSQLPSNMVTFEEAEIADGGVIMLSVDDTTTLAQMRADIDYIAAITGVEL